MLEKAQSARGAAVSLYDTCIGVLLCQSSLELCRSYRQVDFGVPVQIFLAKELTRCA